MSRRSVGAGMRKSKSMTTPLKASEAAKTTPISVMRFSVGPRARSTSTVAAPQSAIADGGEMRRQQLAEARTDDQQHAGKADEDREPAPPADAFSEERDRQDGHEERREEDQRIDLREAAGA